MRCGGRSGVRVVLALCFLARIAVADSKVAVDRVVATINDAVILQSELDARMLPLVKDAQQIVDPKERERRIGTLRHQLLDQMVDDELIVQAAVAAKLAVTPQEVAKAVAYLEKQNKVDDATFDKVLAEQGMSRATIKADLLRQRAINLLIEPKITITDEDVRAAYQHTDNVIAIHIEQALFATRDEAQAAREQIDHGAAFVATSDLGWLQNGKTTTPWDNVIFAMTKGETRGPVHDAKGFHLLHAIDVKTAPVEPFAKVAEALRTELHRRETAKLVHAWVEELRKKAYISLAL